MYYTDFNIWFQTKATQCLNQNINNLFNLVDRQQQIVSTNQQVNSNILPAEYLLFQVQHCLENFKSTMLNELKYATQTNNFISWEKDPLDEDLFETIPNSLIQRARVDSIAPVLNNLQKLAFIDVETDGTNIQTANILQISIVMPKCYPNQLSCMQTYSRYILPYKGYTQQDNKAYNINFIGDNELKTAITPEAAAWNISILLQDAILVGYNINSFDIPLIKKLLNEYNEPLQWKFSIDLYPACWKNKKQKLADAIKAYNLADNLNPHDATADANCCVDLLRELVRKGELPGNEEDLIDLLNSPENTWQHFRKLNIIEVNADNEDYSYLLVKTPPATLKRKYSDISVAQ
jgi:DNA polymerase III epsilon subunit-like protein